MGTAVVVLSYLTCLTLVAAFVVLASAWSINEKLILIRRKEQTLSARSLLPFKRVPLPPPPVRMSKNQIKKFNSFMNQGNKTVVKLHKTNVVFFNAFKRRQQNNKGKNIK